MTDVVYITGTGSEWEDNELRYSLRSIQKYLSFDGKVFIIGNCPAFLREVIHIQEDDQGKNKEERIKNKMLIACDEGLISKDFLLMHDDHFLLAPFIAAEFPWYYEQDIQKAIDLCRKEGGYKSAGINTLNALNRRHHDKKNFDTHHPCLINKKAFKMIINSYYWAIPDGYFIKSLYANTAQIEGEPYNDIRVEGHYDAAGYRNIIGCANLFSTGARINYPEMKKLMEELYPYKSRFEND